LAMSALNESSAEQPPVVVLLLLTLRSYRL
jgi:hypothetical protein